MTERDSTLSAPQALPASTHPHTPGPEVPTILTVRDQLYTLQAAYHFFGDATHELMHASQQVEIAPKTLHGYGIVLDWLRERDGEIMAMLDQINSAQHSSS